MTRRQRAAIRGVAMRAFGWLALVAAATFLGSAAHADGVAQVMTSKSLPDATVAIIDPESGTSDGTEGSDVKIAVGDIILFRFAFTPVPDKINRGLQAYLTEYLPPNTELVGVRYTDAEGNTIEPRLPGIAVDGCVSGACNNSFDNLPCSGGTCDLPVGSIAQVHGDTGVFYTTDARLAPSPGNAFLTMNNGIEMTTQPRTISPGIVALLNDTTAPYFAHNAWDWLQVQAFGFNGDAADTDGKGNPPFGYGSPVAGPQTFYPYEASQVAGVIQFNDTFGPWQRVKSPGARIGTGSPTSGDQGIKRMSVPTSSGFDLTPATPVDPVAVRFAMGETRTGEPGYVEVALRVTGVPIDPTFGTGAANVDCGELFGSDTASRGGNSGGKDNPWPTYVASPACVFLKLLFDLEADKHLAVGNDEIHYTLRGRNLSVDPETGVVVRLKYDASRQSFGAATPAPNSTGTCADDSTKQCLQWNLGTLQPSDEYVIESTFTVGGGGQTTNVLVANYQSAENASPGFSTQAVTIVTGIAVPKVALATTIDPTVTPASAGATAAISGTVRNLGTESFSPTSFALVLPTGWTVNGAVTIGGAALSCSSGCGTATPTYGYSTSVGAGAPSQAVSFAVNVPGGAATGLYTIDAQLWGSQTSFGGQFETYFPKAATVAVAQRRSTRPTLTCPIVSTATSISGTSENDASIRLYFNLMQRGTATATAGGAWTSNDFGAFGELYGGLEVRASAQAPGEQESLLSDPCFVIAVRACSDGVDNDGDGAIDFPADLGCDSPGDNSEVDALAPQCSDGLDNDGDGPRDWPADSGCGSPEDPTEGGGTACADGIDNDGDGDTDFPADLDCASAADATEIGYAACQDGLDNDADGLIDFAGGDPGCVSAFDDAEADGGSSALDTKARLLIVFDSSGSMNWNTCADVFTGGDGSLECAGSDVSCAACSSPTCGAFADDSRLYKVKTGISDAVAAFGEVEYSLMRFHQRAVDFACPTASAGLSSGGWQGGGAAPCSGGFAAGDLLVGFGDDNEQDLLGYMDGRSGYDGDAPPGTDHEIRGSGTTPLAGALGSAFTYLTGVRIDDDQGSCRPYRVILVTDGGETCGGDPVAAAGQLRSAGFLVNVIGFATPDQDIIDSLDDIAIAGGTDEAIFVDDESALSTAMASIITDSILVELCNDLDDDCDSLVDEDFPELGAACDNGEEGLCLEPGERICAGNGLGTVCDAPDGVPGTEICNSIDDDCDGFVDEDLGGTCTCVVLPETCNNADDDCDTFVDEVANTCYTFGDGCTPGIGCDGICQFGLQTCTPQGELGACIGEVGPAGELCNGVDDDCDTFIDEDFPTLGTTCTNGGVGACLLTGTMVCSADGAIAECTAPDVSPGTEICNALDDDCDTFVDEDLGAPIGNECGGGANCTIGELICNADGDLECFGSVGGSAEECNGLDDDCDGTTDEDVPGTGVDCVPEGFEGFGDTGSCEFGHLECTGGEYVCEDYVGPTPEVCNGEDDACDGDDEPTAECPGPDDVCVDGQCAFPCQPGEFACPFGFMCAELEGGEFCVPNPCVGVSCDGGEFCDPADGECHDLCEDVTCSDGRVCHDGGCYDCFVLGCADDELCVLNEDDVGVCELNLCLDIDCEDGEFCRDGTCVPLACEPACADTESCVDGVCVADPCAGVECEIGEVCDPADGECTDDPCLDVDCPAGEACNPVDGECFPDPCITTECPGGLACVLDPSGNPQCREPPEPPVEIITAAGGGCACRASSDVDAGTLFLCLVVLAMMGPWTMNRRRSGTARPGMRGSMRR